MTEEIIQMEYEDLNHAGHGLPHPDPVVQSQFGDGESFLAVSGVIKEVFEVILMFRYINDDCLGWKVFYHCYFVRIHPNAGEKKPQKKSGQLPKITRKKAAVLVLCVLQKGGDPYATRFSQVKPLCLDPLHHRFDWYFRISAASLVVEETTQMLGVRKGP